MFLLTPKRRGQKSLKKIATIVSLLSDLSPLNIEHEHEHVGKKVLIKLKHKVQQPSGQRANRHIKEVQPSLRFSIHTKEGEEEEIDWEGKKRENTLVTPKATTATQTICMKKNISRFK